MGGKIYKFSDEIIKAINLEYENTHRDYIGISEIPYCGRQIYLLRSRKIKKDIPTNILFKFIVGTAGHKIIQELLWKWRSRLNIKYGKKETDVEIKDENGNVIIKGHSDLTFQFKDKSDKPWIVDFKFVGHNHFKMMKEAPLHYKDQLMLYGYGLGIDNLKLAVIDVDPSASYSYIPVKEFDFHINEDRVQLLLKKKQYIDECLKKGEIPQIPFMSPDDSWECARCQFYSECWGGFKPKREGVCAIDENLASQYVKLYKKKKDIEDEMKAILDQITEQLTKKGAKEGTSPYLKLKWIDESVQERLDKAKLKSILGDKYNEVVKVIHKKGYFKTTLLKK